MGKQPLELFAMKSLPLAAPESGSWKVRLEDPARSVMTDFTERPIITVASTQQIDAALELMKHAGVRSAFVSDDPRTSIVGMITAYHILSERPICHMKMLGVTRGGVAVGDVMDKLADWHVARLADVDQATVGSILATFRNIGQTHLAVIEEAERGARLRGVFSAAKLLRLTRSQASAPHPVVSAPSWLESP